MNLHGADRGLTKAVRFADYAEWRMWGEDPECAALRVGVSRRTARRYDAELRQMREAGTAA
jgi:hypothetical protein